MQAPEMPDELDAEKLSFHSSHCLAPCLRCISRQQARAEGKEVFLGVFFSPELVLHLKCLTRALNPLPVWISDSFAGNSEAAIRSCPSHHCGSTDSGHLAFANSD